MADNIISQVNNLQQDILNNLSYLNTKYFNSIRSPALGSITSVNEFNNAITNSSFSKKLFSDLIFNNLLDPSINNSQQHFNLNYNSQVNDNYISFVTIDGNGNFKTFNNVPISTLKKGTGNYSSVASQLMGPNTITTALMFNDIPSASPEVFSKSHMEVLYFLYDLFSDANFKGYFVQGASVKLNNPFTPYQLNLTRDPTSNKTIAEKVTSSLTDIPTPFTPDFDRIMQDILGFDTSIITNNIAKYPSLIDVNKLNNFAIKRIIYLYIMTINIHYALSASYNYTRTVYNSNNNNTTAYYSDPHVIALNTFINTLITILDSTASQSTVQNIMNTVSNEMNIYKNNIDSINTLSKSFTKSRNKLTTGKSKLDGDLRSEKSVKIFEYVSFVILLVIVIAVIFIYLMDIDNSKKTIFIGCITIFAIISSILVNSVFNKIESFAPSSSSSSNSNNAQSSSVITTDYQNNAIATLTIMDAYIKNTSVLISQIDTYNAYHVVNYSIGNETTYFAGQKSEIGLTATKLENVFDIKTITKTEECARMNLFLTLAIITSATACANVATSSIPVLQQILTIIGGVLAVIAFILYVIDITYIVRTDGKRKYYGIKHLDAEKLLK